MRWMMEEKTQLEKACYDQRLAASEGQLSFVYRQIMSEKQDVENGSAAVDKNSKVLAKASNTMFSQF